MSSLKFAQPPVNFMRVAILRALAAAFPFMGGSEPASACVSLLSSACIAILPSIARTRAQLWAVILLEFTAGFLSHLWVARFGRNYIPIIFGILWAGRILIAILAGRMFKSLLTRVLMSCAAIVAWDMVVGRIAPYFAWSPLLLPYGSIPIMLNVLNWCPVVGICGAIGVYMSLSASYIVRTRLGLLIFFVFSLLCSWRTRRPAETGPIVYCVSIPKLYAIFDNPAAQPLFYRELKSSLSDLKSDDVVFMPEGVFPDATNWPPRRIPMMQRDVFKQTIIVGLHGKISGNDSMEPGFVNYIANVGPYGAIRSYYAKQLLIPFGEFVPKWARHQYASSLSAVGGNFVVPPPTARPQMNFFLGKNRVDLYPVICIEVCNFSQWQRAVGISPMSELISVHSDESRFESDYSGICRIRWCRLLAAYSKRPVLDVCAYGTGGVYFTDGNFRKAEVLSETSLIRLSLVRL